MRSGSLQAFKENRIESRKKREESRERDQKQCVGDRISGIFSRTKLLF